MQARPPPGAARLPYSSLPLLIAAKALALLDACGDWPTGIRNRALLAALYRGGLRLNEALELRPKDMDGETGAVRVLCGKGGRARTMGLDEGALALLDRWLAASCAGLTSGAFPPQLAVKAGIAERVHAHGLRHTRAAELRAEGVDIGIISKQLGHTSIATAVRYLDQIAPVAVAEAMRGREWRHSGA